MSAEREKYVNAWQQNAAVAGVTQDVAKLMLKWCVPKFETERHRAHTLPLEVRPLFNSFLGYRDMISHNRRVLRVCDHTPTLEQDMEAGRIGLQTNMRVWKSRMTTCRVEGREKMLDEWSAAKLWDNNSDGGRAWQAYRVPGSEPGEALIRQQYDTTILLRPRPMWGRNVRDRRLGEGGNPWVGGRFILSAELLSGDWSERHKDAEFTAAVRFIETRPKTQGLMYQIKDGFLCARSGLRSIGLKRSLAEKGVGTRATNEVVKRFEENM